MSKDFGRGDKLPKQDAPPIWDLLQVEGPGVWVQFVKAGLNDYTFRTISDRRGQGIFHQFWYPGWRVLVDGKDLPLRREEERGLIQFEIPEGVHEIRIFFAGPKLRSAVGLLSWLAAGGVLCWLCLGGLLPFLKRPRAQPRANTG